MSKAQSLKLGLVVLENEPGSGGGVDLYTRGLAEAIADYTTPEECQASVLAWSESLASWRYRNWPAHVRFVSLVRDAGPLSAGRRLLRGLRRRLHLKVEPIHGVEYLAGQIDSAGFEVVHFPKTLMYPRPIRTPSVLTFFDIQHEYFPDFFTPADLAGRRLAYRASIEAATHLVVPSEFTKRSLTKKLNVPENQMTLIPAGIRESFRPQPVEALLEVRSRLSLPANFIIYPANPWPHKNHARLMAALRYCRTSEPTFPKLVLFGRLRNETRDYRSLALAADVEDGILDLGYVSSEDLPALYAAAVFMVFPSLFEGFGMPIIEAQACGCPVTAARATSIPELALDSALYFDPESVSEIAEAMLCLWRDVELRAKLARMGTERAPSFSWQAVLPDLLKVYEKVAARGSELGREASSVLSRGPHQ